MASKHALPSLPMLMNVWHWPNTPAGPPDDIVNAALRVDVGNILTVVVTGSAQFILHRMIYVAKGTDLRPQWPTAGRGDVVELPAGTGRFYFVWDVDDVAKGEPNEFRIGRVVPNTAPGGAWPVPMP